MRKNWKNSNASVFGMIFIYYLAILTLSLLLNLRTTGKYGGEFWANYFESVIVGILFVLFFLFVPPVWIHRKNVIRIIEIDTDNHLIILTDKINKKFSLELSSICFSKKYFSVFTILTFYKIEYSSHSKRYFPQKLYNIIASDFGVIWKSKELKEIIDILRNLKVREINELNNSFIDDVV